MEDIFINHNSIMVSETMVKTEAHAQLVGRKQT